MILHLNNLSINVIYNPAEINSKIPILFLHGFLGSSSDWDFVDQKLPMAFTKISVDLVGHGLSESPPELEYYTENSYVKIINELLDSLSLDDIIIVGYSMGGRIALNFAINYPNKVKSLFLESTSFGIENKFDRESRLKLDMKHVQKLESDGLESFIDYWINLPLFDSLKKLDSYSINKIRTKRIETNNIIGIKNTLIGFSPGVMKFFGNLLHNIQCTITQIVGEKDKKYCSIAEEVSKKHVNCNVSIIEDCGHNVHLEKPEEFLKLLNDFLFNIKNKGK